MHHYQNLWALEKTNKQAYAIAFLVRILDIHFTEITAHPLQGFFYILGKFQTMLFSLLRSSSESKKDLSRQRQRRRCIIPTADESRNMDRRTLFLKPQEYHHLLVGLIGKKKSDCIPSGPGSFSRLVPGVA